MAVQTMSARVETATLPKYIKEVTEPGKVDNTLLKLLMAKGAVKYRCGGTKTDWPLEYDEIEPVEYQDGDPVSAPRVSRERRASVQWRSWVHGESFGEVEKLAQQDSETVLFRLVSRAVAAAGKSFIKFVGKRIYTDGDATTGKVIDGMETMYSDISTTQSGSSSTVGHPCTPAGSYANTSMVLNYYGSGSWSGGTWPEGQGLKSYYWFSPVVAKANADWGLSASTWEANWRKLLNYVSMFTETLHGVQPQVFVTTPQWKRQALDSLPDKERIIVGQNQELVKLGFSSINWNGIDLISDYHCTQNACYGINFKEAELRSMLPQLFRKKGDEDITIMTQIVQFDAHLNMKFSSPGFFPGVRNL